MTEAAATSPRCSTGSRPIRSSATSIATATCPRRWRICGSSGRDSLRCPRASRPAFCAATALCLYDQAVLKWLAGEDREGGPKGFIGFTISADMSKQLRAACEALPDDNWKLVEERANETVFAADVEFTPGDWSKDAKPLRYVAVKFIGRQLDLDGKVHIKYLAVVSNRRDMEAADLLNWHWQKAGTIEHVHDVIKNDLGGATPPCGRFGANAAWFRFATLAYNVLSAVKQLALPPSMETARPKRLRFALFSLAARITSHAGSLVMKLGRAAEHLADLVASRLRLAELVVT